MLIVEGTDLVGKTTLCKKLVECLNERGIHTTIQHFGLLDNDWDFYHDYLGYINRTTIMDRFIMSEVVYGHVIRGRSRINAQEYRMLDAWLTLDCSITVVITADPAWLQKQLDGKYLLRAETYKPEQILAVNSGFQSLIRKDQSSSHWSSRMQCNFDYAYEINDRTGFPSNDSDFVWRIADEYVCKQHTLRRLKDERY